MTGIVLLARYLGRRRSLVLAGALAVVGTILIAVDLSGR